jgi:glycosyltransferase involved in cell wall biosynthesis
MIDEPLPAKKRRPKLLFLAHSFPPANTSGSVRTWNIAKYLARLGWDVTVVTPHPNLCRNLNDPAEADAALQREGIQKILTAHRWRCLLPLHLKHWNHGVGRYAGGICRRIARRFGIERGIGWIKPTERACASLGLNDVDIILATGLPFASFLIARRLSNLLACPYVLDYRDPWTGNPHTAHPFRPATMRKEASLLADAAAVTIVSPSWAAELDRLFRLGPKLHVVTNGYDPEEFAEVRPYEFGHFAIVYAGRFYPPKRVITPVMRALKSLKDECSTSTGYFFHYYGPHQEHVRAEAKRYDVSERVVLHGEVAQSVALSAVRGASVVVVITSVSESSTLDEQGIVTGKIFEPVGLNMPVLLVCPPGSDAEAVLRTAGLGEAFRASDIGGIACFFRNVMLGRGVRPGNRSEYSWPSIAKNLDDVLRGALRGRTYQKL